MYWYFQLNLYKMTHENNAHLIQRMLLILSFQLSWTYLTVPCIALLSYYNQIYWTIYYSIWHCYLAWYQVISHLAQYLIISPVFCTNYSYISMYMLCGSISTHTDPLNHNNYPQMYYRNIVLDLDENIILLDWSGSAGYCNHVLPSSTFIADTFSPWHSIQWITVYIHTPAKYQYWILWLEYYQAALFYFFVLSNCSTCIVLHR